MLKKSGVSYCGSGWFGFGYRYGADQVLQVETGCGNEDEDEYDKDEEGDDSNESGTEGHEGSDYDTYVGVIPLDN